MSAAAQHPAPTSWERLEDPGLFMAIEDLSLAAQGIVEGALQGLHRSRLRGHGAEFDSHREYQGGDDLRYLDWNLYARHGRYFTKQFQADTNLHLYLLIDATGSMGMKRGTVSKFRYAARAAAALALLTRRTRDAAGLYLLRAGIAEALPPRCRSGQFDDIIAMLEATAPSGAADVGAALEAVIETCRRRGMVVLFSDFLDQEETLMRGMRILRQQGHEVVAVQTLDPWECALPEHGDFEFADLETGQTLKTGTQDIRDSYARAVADWRERLARECRAAGVHWVSAITSEPLIPVVTQCALAGTVD
jgi:uncharacterized protein (DUF58 family)